VKSYTLTWEFLKSRCHCETRDDGCWLWKEGVNRDGYPTMSHEDKETNVARKMFEMFYGKAPPPMLVRKCQRRRCIRPEHMTPHSRAAAARKQAREGRMASTARRRAASLASKPGAKLDWDQVRDMRKRLNAGESVNAVATDYGMSPMTVYKIHNQTIWREGLLA
jgi:hypothetical protein